VGGVTSTGKAADVLLFSIPSVVIVTGSSLKRSATASMAPVRDYISSNDLVRANEPTVTIIESGHGNKGTNAVS
jgi:hypothetical protein